MMSANTPPATQPARSAPPEAPNPIPVEILSRIISQLSTPELGRSARASRLLYLIATPLLYRTVHIDISLPINPLFINGVPIPNFPWETNEPTSITQPSTSESNAFVTHASSLEPVHLPLIPMHDRFLYTIHLTLRAHFRDQCSLQLPSLLAVPSLQSLRVLPNAEDHRLDLCTAPNELPGPLEPEPCCALMRGLHPHKVILGGPTTGLSGSARGLHSKLPSRNQFDSVVPNLTSSFPPPRVKELVIHVGVPSGPGYHVCLALDEPIALFLKELPASLTRVTFVLSTLQAGQSNLSSLAGISDIHLASVITINLGEACSGDAQVVELADYEAVVAWHDGGCLNRNGPAMSLTPSFKDHLTSEIAYCWTTRGLTMPEAEDRANEVQYLDGEEWRARLDEDIGAEVGVMED